MGWTIPLFTIWLKSMQNRMFLWVSLMTGRRFSNLNDGACILVFVEGILCFCFGAAIRRVDVLIGIMLGWTGKCTGGLGLVKISSNKVLANFIRAEGVRFLSREPQHFRRSPTISEEFWRFQKMLERFLETFPIFRQSQSEVWFSAGWGTKEAENVFLTHGWESGYPRAGGFKSRGFVRVSVFVLPSVIAWHAPPTHPWSTFRM